MGDAAYWDNWADAIGPARLLPSPSGRGAGGEGRQQRLSSHSRLQPKAIRSGIRAKISPHPCRRPGGSLPPPGPPLAVFPVRVGGPAGDASGLPPLSWRFSAMGLCLEKYSDCGLTSPRLHSRTKLSGRAEAPGTWPLIRNRTYTRIARSAAATGSTSVSRAKSTLKNQFTASGGADNAAALRPLSSVCSKPA